MTALAERILLVDVPRNPLTLERSILQNLPEASREQVKQAIDFASIKHAGQTRNDGRPQMTHPLEAMVFVQKYLPDHPNLVTILQLVAIHDVYEDTQTSLREIEDAFSPDMAEMVLLLSKEMFGEKIVANDDEYFARMTSPALSEEMREMLAIAKVADRLQNNKTLRSLVPRTDDRWNPYERRAVIFYKQIEYLAETKERIIPLLDKENSLRRALEEETERQEQLLGFVA